MLGGERRFTGSARASARIGILSRGSGDAGLALLGGLTAASGAAVLAKRRS